MANDLPRAFRVKISHNGAYARGIPKLFFWIKYSKEGISKLTRGCLQGNRASESLDEGFALMMFKAMRLRVAKFAGVWSLRARCWSSFITTSRDQCKLFSICQWPRINAAVP